ncbi:RING-H2 finger protein ATL46-like [Silene latifolia]|uniref:RING-H2 finger protein ATL46-like n=1 Tax=Silene latifolia TaxID=37657 RepID=UPI003D780886
MSLFQSQNHHNFFQRDTISQATPPSSSSAGKISPAILFIIIILAVIFFISGLLHLLIRFFMKQRHSSSAMSQSNGYTDNVSNSDAMQRQLQQLFHLHDSGLDQAFIDALPLFQYKEIVGLKEPFDCAVCLCEFSEQDKLRLLPLCSHAFHIDCIDTWLLSNSTCPLCRGSLYAPGFAIENPVFDYEDMMDDDGSGGVGMSYNGIGGGGCGMVGKNQKPFEIEIVGEKKVFPVRLGKFRSTSNEVRQEEGVVFQGRDVGETSSSLDARRCYSMGSYQYVVGNSMLQVAVSPDKNPLNETVAELKNLSLRNGLHRNSTTATSIANADAEARKINIGSKVESLSVSKIWLWSKKSKFPNSSIADFSGSNVDMSLPWSNRAPAS